MNIQNVLETILEECSIREKIDYDKLCNNLIKSLGTKVIKYEKPKNNPNQNKTYSMNSFVKTLNNVEDDSEEELQETEENNSENSDNKDELINSENDNCIDIDYSKQELLINLRENEYARLIPLKENKVMMFIGKGIEYYKEGPKGIFKIEPGLDIIIHKHVTGEDTSWIKINEKQKEIII